MNDHPALMILTGMTLIATLCVVAFILGLLCAKFFDHLNK